MEEDKVSISSKFITLTYADENLPISRNGYRSLCRRDLQLFFKRLRKAHSKGAKRKSIKYFAVGEYGGKIGRPHYHVLLFNADISLVEGAWCNYRTANTGIESVARRLQSDGSISKQVSRGQKFKMGHIDYGDKRGVSGASIGYCCKYMLKPKDPSTFAPDEDSQREFMICSKGLGIDYLNTKMVSWHRSDIKGRMYINLGGGKKATMPRYYKEKIYTKNQRTHIHKAIDISFAEKILEDLFKEYNTSDAYEYDRRVSKRKWEKQQRMEAAYSKQKSLNKKHVLV